MKQTITTPNGFEYNILSIQEVTYYRAKRNVIDNHLKGIPDPQWLIPNKEYHVKVKSPNEPYNRTFILTEQEAKKQLQ